MLKLIILIIIGLLALSFFGISLQHIVDMPTTHENFVYVTGLLTVGWNQLIALCEHAFAQGAAYIAQLFTFHF
jgi:hypothetical protein